MKHRKSLAKGAVPTALGFVLLLLAGSVWAADEAGPAWLLVDTQARTAMLMRGEEVVERFDDIAIGRAGAAADRRLGDDRTPLGTFHIVRINGDSRFHRFYGFDYPTREHADRALAAGVITEKDHKRILSAHAAGREPPSNTPLGGKIGLHGIGAGDIRVHRDFNWTEGCIALTNYQIDRLSKWLEHGTRVVVK